MSQNSLKRRTGAIVSLKRFVQPERPPKQEIEICELCSQRLAPRHRHLFESATRAILCACDGCALRFQDVVGGRFQLIPRDARSLPEFELSEDRWEGLALPINLAFFFHSTPAGKLVALYPSPAGATESLLPLSTWAEIAATNPSVAGMKPDVEALLVNRVARPHRHYLAPIDVCYELVGLIRMHWRGLSGGDSVWSELEGFFSRLDGDCPAERAEVPCG
ncbi:MAG TPA: DUF5947 family protein [Opitutaceae bacterium]|jgi:hypothetical protein